MQHTYNIADCSAALATAAQKLNQMRSAQGTSWRDSGGVPRFAAAMVHRNAGAPLRVGTDNGQGGTSLVRAMTATTAARAAGRIKMSSNGGQPWDSNSAELRNDGTSMIHGPVTRIAQRTTRPGFCGGAGGEFISWRYKNCSLPHTKFNMTWNPSAAQRKLMLKKRWVNQQLAHDRVEVEVLEKRLRDFQDKEKLRRERGAARVRRMQEEEEAGRRRFGDVSTGWCKVASSVPSCTGGISVEESLQGMTEADKLALEAEALGSHFEELSVEDDRKRAAATAAAVKRVQDRLHGGGLMLRIIDVFRAFDTDYSGTVDRGEFRRGLSSLGLALDDDEFALVVNTFDKDGDGEIDYEEFDRQIRRKIQSPGKVRRASRIFLPDDDKTKALADRAVESRGSVRSSASFSFGGASRFGDGDGGSRGSSRGNAGSRQGSRQRRRSQVGQASGEGEATGDALDSITGFVDEEQEFDLQPQPAIGLPHGDLLLEGTAKGNKRLSHRFGTSRRRASTDMTQGILPAHQQ